MSQPVALVSPAPQDGRQRAQKGYGFMNASMTSDTATKYSGENVSSMFNMTSPIPTRPRPSRLDASDGASAPAGNRGGLGGALSAQSSAATQAAAGGSVPLPGRSRRPR